jgi:ferredoxin--NADP+ reductase
MAQANHVSAELIERTEISANLAVFRFLPREPLSFTAGQYAIIGIDTDGDLIERPYSIASSPSETFLEFFVELVPGGHLTPKLWELKLGSTIRVRPRIAGHFNVEITVKRHLMLATVTGVAPFISMLRTQQIERARGAKSDDRFLVIHGASRSADFGPYLGEIEALSRLGWLSYVPTISRPWEDLNWKGETGRIEDIVRKHADHLGFDCSKTMVYACGHPGMVENVKDVLVRARFTEKQIRQEEYFKLHDSQSTERYLPVNLDLRSASPQGKCQSDMPTVLG